METTIPSPKDIVIVLDRSGSMEIQNIMDLAKDAASTVLIFGDAKYSQALKYKPCIGKISMVYLCKSK